MTHPLTDEICDQITDELSIFSVEDCMRSAYDLGENKGRADMLNEVIEWVKHCPGYHLEFSSESWKFILDLKEAMRPQVVDLPQANSDVCGEEGMERARQRTLEENDELMRLLADS